jgi:tetratricopeptide (TPR) repeat protein
MARSTLSKTLSVSVALLCFGTTARGQTAGPSAEDEARSLFNQATERYAARDFSPALELFLAAYEKSKLPGFLYNIGLTYRQLWNCPQARRYFTQYLEAKPNAANRSTVEAQLKELDACPDKPVLGPTPSSKTAPAAALENPAGVEPAHFAWGPKLLLAAGAATALGGSALVVVERVRFQQLETTCAPGCSRSDWAGAPLREKLGYGFLAAGFSLAAAGGLWWWLADTAPPSSALTFSPTLGGLTAQGAF